MNKTIGTTIIAAAAATGAAFTAMAIDEINVAAGQTLTTNGVSASSAIKKTGEGTLVLSGANNLKRLQVAAGTVNIHGGSTTISDSGATGTDAGNQVLESLPEAEGILIDGGATVTLTDGAHANVKGGTLVVTNATLDATGLAGDFMIAHRWVGTDGCMVVVGNGGTLKANNIRPASSGSTDALLKELVGIRLDKGGSLYLKKFYLDLDKQYYGRILFNGGVLHPRTANGSLFHEASATHSSTTWGADYVTPTVLKGGCHIQDDVGAIVYQAFHSGVGEGEKDGGVHFSGTADVTWHARGSTFNGGTWLGSAGHLLKINPTYGDSIFGAVPSAPENNIFATTNNTILYNQSGTFVINPNRNVLIADGVTFRATAAANARLVFGGEINGERRDGEDYPTTTVFEAYGGWAGTAVIGPGDGRTNSIGRLVATGVLEVTNGVTCVSSGIHGTASDKALVFVSGKLSVLNGATIYAPQTVTSYATVNAGGQVDICGGTVSMPNSDWCNAHGSAALTTIRDGGVLDVGNFRMGQMVSDGSTVVRLATNGLLRAKQIYLWTNNDNNLDVTFLFDGGAVQSANGADTLFTSPTNAKWEGVKFAVGPGGAVLDTSNGKNIWWRRPLVTAAEGVPDGGLIARRVGAAGAVILMVPSSYNGPTTVDGAALQQRGGDNLLPSGTKLVLTNGGSVGFCKYDGATQQAHTRTEATLGGIEGSGTLNYCGKVTVNGKVAPSVGGTITFYETCAFSNAVLEIDGNASGCGKLAFSGTSGPFEGNQDISGLTLSIKDPSALDSNAPRGTYKIVGNGKYTGAFSLAADFPSNGWQVKYLSTGVYLEPVKAFTMVIR